MPFCKVRCNVFWNLNSDSGGCLLPLPEEVRFVRQLYPIGYPCKFQLTEDKKALSVVLPPAPSARLFLLDNQ